MSNVSLRDRNAGSYIGTILAAGTLSAEINLNGFSLVGAIFSGMTNCTLTAQVAEKSDASGGTYVDLVGSNAAAIVFLGPTGTGGALGGVTLEPLRPFMFVKFKTSIAQAGGVVIYIPVKA